MLEQVESKIQELKQLRTEEYYKKKDEDLQAWGLTYKKDGKKVTPIIVTDEEYEALIKAANGVGSSGRNAYAKSLRVLAFIVIGLGAIGGSVAASIADSLSIVYFSLSLIAGLILGAVFFGLSEAIRLLQQIVDDKPNAKPDYIEKKDPAKAAAKPRKKEAPQAQSVQTTQQTVYTQVPYQPVYTAQSGQPVYAQAQPVYQQPPVYIYTQQPPVQTQPADSGIHYGEKNKK